MNVEPRKPTRTPGDESTAAELVDLPECAGAPSGRRN